MCVFQASADNVVVSRDGKAVDSGIKTDVNLNHEVYYHFLGTDQPQDVLCWRDPDHPKYIYIPEVTEDGKVCCAFCFVKNS